MAKLSNKHIIVFGISADSVVSHRDFARSERLNFALLADTSKQTIKQYGVLGTNGLPQRVTFLIGPDGVIRGIDGTVERQFSGKTADGARISQHGENLALLLSDWKARVGDRVPDFFLPDSHGQTVSPRSSGKTRQARVIVFLGVQCPLSGVQASLLGELSANPVYKDVDFFGIAPNQQETAQEVEAFVTANLLPFPLARDPFHEITDHFEVTLTPTVFVLDRQGKVVYRGALAGSQGTTQVNYVREALDAVLTGRRVPVAETPPVGSPLVSTSRP